MDAGKLQEWAEAAEALGYYLDVCTQKIDEVRCGGPVIATEDGSECLACGHVNALGYAEGVPDGAMLLIA
jgi:hypothetical protein